MDDQQQPQQTSTPPAGEPPQVPQQPGQPEHITNNVYSTDVPKRKNYKKVLLAVLFIILLAGVSVGAWMMLSGEDEPEPAPAQMSDQSAEQTEVVEEEVEPEPQVYTSRLYPDFSFTVPNGWVVTEPEAYDEGEWGPGNAAGVITVTKDEVTLNLAMRTVYATGFEGYSCSNVDNLTAVGEYYRYTDNEGLTVFKSGLTEADDAWETTITNTDFTTLEDPDPNLCVSFPFIGTYSSTLNQADYDLPYGFENYEQVIVWLEATVSGPVNEAALADIDSIIESKSASIES